VDRESAVAHALLRRWQSKHCRRGDRCGFVGWG
jgi:hypothetical protein